MAEHRPDGEATALVATSGSSIRWAIAIRIAHMLDRRGQDAAATRHASERDYYVGSRNGTSKWEEQNPVTVIWERHPAVA